MGWMLCHSACCNCGRIFSYNPNRVPSIRINGEREAVCRECVEMANSRRTKLGHELISVHPDAYDPEPVA